MENTVKSSSCLAITEKKTHKPGGCIGIFFQLFDWNRRLAKKKLFSRKLLPPARTNQATKKFKGGEKMAASKIHLIADENRGGFPNVKKNGNRGTDLEHKNEMRVPGLVARLMGLETMPAVNRDKLKKGCISDSSGNGGKKFVEDLNMDKSSEKIEARPLKLRKTGPSEKKIISHIGSEVLQYKNVLSRPKKHHHPSKIAPHMKSPRIPSGKNMSRASRLIDVASKILEPGLQASNRAKLALPNPRSMQYSQGDAISREVGTVPMDSCDSSKSFMGLASCKNCNNLLKVEVLNHAMEEKPHVISPHNSNHVGAFSEGSGRIKTMPPELPLLKGRDEVLENCDEPQYFASKHYESNHASITQGVPQNNEPLGESIRHSSQQFNLRKNESAVAFKHQDQSEARMSSVRDRMPSRSKLSNVQRSRITSSGNAVGGTKNFVASNRSLNRSSRSKLPTTVETSTFQIERKSFNGREDFPSPSKTSMRKRRTANMSGQIESKDSVDSSHNKQQFPQVDAMPREHSRLDRKALSTKQSCARSRSISHREGERVYRKDNGVVTFPFNSPIRKKKGVASDTDVGMGKERKISSPKTSVFGRDAIGVLEQKLKELTSREDDELALGSPLKRSTAIILQELLSAIAAEGKVPLESSIVNVDATFSDDAIKERLVRMCKGDHLSPGSVLEASFSSSSVDDSSGCRIPAESFDYSNDHFLVSEPDADFSDSATSLNKQNVGSEMATELLSNISKILHSYNFTSIKLTGSKLSHAMEVVFNTEVLFGNFSPNSMEGNDLLILPLFINELNTLACEMWTSFSDSSDLEDDKVINHLRGFLFDSLIEFLDCKFSQVWSFGFNDSEVNAKTLIGDVGKEIEKWRCLVGMMTDDIVDWEMSHCLGKWNDFRVEEFENGAEIDGDILQILVEEIVVDLWKCKSSF